MHADAPANTAWQGRESMAGTSTLATAPPFSDKAWVGFLGSYPCNGSWRLPGGFRHSKGIKPTEALPKQCAVAA